MYFSTLLSSAFMWCICRSPLAEFLLAEGQTSSWLLGNKVITITTSSRSKASIGSLIKPLSSESSVLESSSSPQQPAGVSNGKATSSLL